jgi:hypothetical protein
LVPALDAIRRLKNDNVYRSGENSAKHPIIAVQRIVDVPDDPE